MMIDDVDICREIEIERESLLVYSVKIHRTRSKVENTIDARIFVMGDCVLVRNNSLLRTNFL
jgi:hypothetical protein